MNQSPYCNGREVKWLRTGPGIPASLALGWQDGHFNHGDVGEQLKRNAAQEFEAHGEVLEYVPPRLLVWSWIANWHAHPAHPTVVRWELTPTGNGTRVRVTHIGLTQEPVSRKDYKSGWQGVLRLLHEFLRKF